jgi:predicted ArsR family transcriptional regulator
VDESSGSLPEQRDAARAGLSRQRILGLLREASHALGVQEMAERTGLHPNTVRFHLDRLVADEVVARHVEERTEPGRPRLVFTAVPRPDPARDRRNYQFLAEILTGHLSGTAADPAAAATEAGRVWGRYLVERPAPFQQVTEQQAVGQLLRILDEIGFSPALDPDDPRRILIPHCPFRELAATHREVVCSIHLGLMRGALAEMGAPVTADRLYPFVEPSLCVAHLAPASDAERPSETGRGGRLAANDG